MATKRKLLSSSSTGQARHPRLLIKLTHIYMVWRTIVKLVAVSSEWCLCIWTTCGRWGPERPCKANFQRPGAMVDTPLAFHCGLPCNSIEIPESLGFNGFSIWACDMGHISLPLPSLEKLRDRETKHVTQCRQDAGARTSQMCASACGQPSNPRHHRPCDQTEG